MPLRRINSTQSRELFSTLLTILLMFITDKRSFSRINLNYSNLSRSKTKHKKYLREIRSLQEINFRSSIFLGRDQQRWKTADGNMYWSLFEKYKLVNQSIAAGDITEKHFFSMQLHLFIICLNECLVSEYILSLSFTAQLPSIFPNSPYQCTNNIRKNTNIYISPSGKESQHAFKPRWNITYTLCGLKKSKSCKINDWRLMSGATCASKPADPASDLLHTFPKSSIFISRNISGEHFSV